MTESAGPPRPGPETPAQADDDVLKRRVVFYILARLVLATLLLALTAVLVVGPDTQILDPRRYFYLVAAT